LTGRKNVPAPDFSTSTVDWLLCDADGTLFSSEQPAFEASAAVTRRCLDSLGIDRRFTAAELRQSSTGKSFRSIITELARLHGVPTENSDFRTTLDRWVAEENAVVTAHLVEVLMPDPEVSAALVRLSRRHQLAVVSSSASSRIDACLDQTGLGGLFAEQRRFSAQDSLTVPTSKPDPSIYRWAGQQLAVTPTKAVAIEDAAAGAQSAVAAGFPTVGMIGFVPGPERAQRIHDLEDAGVMGIVASWPELEGLLAAAQTTTQASEGARTEQVPA
jgi:beta-phosphoglucomutase-like phosphatase (HAD superfamily)